MIHKSVFVAVCLLHLVYAANPYLKSRPSFVISCPLNDANFKACNLKQIQQLFDNLMDGVPEIGIFPLDPLNVTKIKILSGEGPVSIDVDLHDIIIKGFRQMKLVTNEVNRQHYGFTSFLTIPQLRLDGKYKSDGRVLIVPLKGEGDCWFDCKGVEINCVCETHLYKKKEHFFFNISNVHIDLKINDLKFQLSNLFEGNSDLSTGTNDYLNQNWKEIYDGFKPVLTDTIESILLTILAQVFHSIPAEYFFPDVKFT